jgi:hypothetical protein
MNDREKLERCEDVLRGLAALVGCGGYNADTVDPDEFDAKIREGFDLVIAPLLERAAKAEARAAELERQLEDTRMAGRLFAHLVNHPLKAGRLYVTHDREQLEKWLTTFIAALHLHPENTP